MNRTLFSSASVHWSTPKDLYDSLNEKFEFTFDPCPLHGKSGLNKSWGKRNFVNPPYGRGVNQWLEKGVNESFRNKLCVFLLPVRTDTKWFHQWVLPYAKEIIFLKGRLKFGGSKNSAPFPSMIIIFSNKKLRA